MQLDEDIAVCIIWQRGNKKVKSKARTLRSKNNYQVNFEENILVNTVVEVSASTGNPIK